MFRFRFDYTLEDMNALSRVAAKTYRRKKVLITRMVMALLGLAYLAMGALLLFHQSWVTGGIIFAAGVFFAAVAIFYHQGAAWRSKRMMVAGEGAFTVELEEKSVWGRSEKGESAYPYSAVTGAYYYKERYFLFVDKRHAMLLPERGLVEGDAMALKSFLEERLKKEIKEIH